MEAFYENEKAKLYYGDCLEVMDYLIAKGVKFDAIITDPPYGTTACAWDSIIPFKDMWDKLTKLAKDKAPIILFGSEPFSSQLRMSNIKLFRHDWIWQKEQGANFMLMKYQPQKIHEIISVFSKSSHNYYPLKTKGKKYRTGSGYVQHLGTFSEGGRESDERYPKSIIKCNTNKTKSFHPTQKPVPLLSYLIKTYTKENDLILDFTAGSFSTIVSAYRLNRKSIGIEISKKYCNIGMKRIKNLEK